MGGGNGQVLIGGDARGTSQYAGSTLAVSGDTNITGELRVKDGIYISDGASAGSAYIQLGNSNDYDNFTSAQLHLAGGTNAGFQTVGSRKIFLSDYDNDNANKGVTLFECIDENQNVAMAQALSVTGNITENSSRVATNGRAVAFALIFG